MPEEIEGKIKLRVIPWAIRKRPQLGVHIGVISSIWSDIEEQLIWLFVFTVQAEAPLAAAILGEVFSVATKLNIIETAMQMRFSSQALKPWRRLTRRIKKAASERNEIVHSMWTLHRKHPRALIRVAGISDPKMRLWKYTLGDFLEIERRLLEVSRDLRQFVQSLEPSLELTDEERRERFWRLTAPTPAAGARARPQRLLVPPTAAPSRAPHSKRHPRPAPDSSSS